MNPKHRLNCYFCAGGGKGEGNNDNARTTKTMIARRRMTPKYSFKDIAEQFEFWSFSGGPNVFHEYSSYNFSGLLKDLIPTMKFVCHIFKNANFPEPEIKQTFPSKVSPLVFNISLAK